MVTTILAILWASPWTAFGLLNGGLGLLTGGHAQRTGRVLRAFQDKTHGTIYDFADEGYEMLRFQAYARRRVYRKLGYSFGNSSPAPAGKPPTTQLSFL